MTAEPFFSILLPTKNRSSVVAQAIKSALSQEFDDFELIVSDNDDDPVATKKIVLSFNDPRIKYLRTSGKLSMSDNWQNALSVARGSFILVLQDKQVLYPDALLEIHKVIRSNNDLQVLTWRSNVGFFNGGEECVIRDRLAGRVWSEDSECILNDFVENGHSVVWSRLPRMINSCVSAGLLEEFDNSGKLSKFFVDVTPDVSASFIQLAIAEKIYHLDRSLVVSSSLQLSGGLAVRQRSEAGQRFFDDIVSERQICEHVPIKNRHVVSNLILDDYFNIQQAMQGRLLDHPVNDYFYAKAYVSDVARNLADGILFPDTYKDALAFIQSLPIRERIALYTSFLLLVIRHVSNKAKLKFSFFLSSRKKERICKLQDVIHL